MSKIEVDQVDPQSGTTLTLGTSGDTVNIPSGVTITNNGNQTGFGRTGTVNWQSSIKTANFTAVSGEGYFCDTNSVGAFTLTLPASPSVGDIVGFKDYADTFASANLTIGRNSQPIEGGSNDAIISAGGVAVLCVYADSTKGWLVTTSGNKSDMPTPYSIDFLVIGGGGGGGSADDNGTHSAGGGGAGGFRTSTQSTSPGETITITVGDGGAGGAGGYAAGSNGAASSISGTGFTTISSAGGGGGGGSGGANDNSGNGGSGGGAHGNVGNTGGSGNTPSTSPAQGTDGGDINSGSDGAGAGGGGATTQGTDNSTNGPTAGGAGTANSITGSSVTRAGGGGGGGNSNISSGAAGGTGGGGAGGNRGSSNGTAGTANTGGGGGGGPADSTSSGRSGGAGGKGVVILSVPTSRFSSSTTGSPTVTTSGSNTIMQFNSTGSYTT